MPTVIPNLGKTVPALLLFVFQSTLATAASPMPPPLSAYVGSYEAGADRLEVGLVSGHILMVVHGRNRGRHCWITRADGSGLMAVNGVEADYSKEPLGLFPTDLYGQLSLDHSGITDIESNPSDSDETIHWRRVSSRPDMKLIDRACLVKY
jgi:hypothetical protein